MLNLKYLPVQFSFFLGLGIFVGYYSNIPIHILFSILSVIILSLFYYYLKAKKSLKPPYNFSIYTLIVFFIIGLINIELRKPINQKRHYLNQKSNYKNITIKVTNILKPTNYYLKYEGEVLKTDSINTTGKVLINIKKKEINKEINVDDFIFSTIPLSKIKEAKNPGEFNYQKYVYKKGIYRQLILEFDNFIVQKPRYNSLKGYAFKLRKRINNDLKKYKFSKNELSIFNAILLGQRQDITKEVFENYKNAGAIHILAVSGLHIGIILFLLNFLLKPIEILKQGKQIKLFLLVLFLWIYAFIAGLSPSVIRAVTMFTAVAIGLLSNRTSGVKNSLVISLFILLLINPFYLFDVGFQLSYIAVFSIVLIQPILVKLWNPNIKIIRYFWQLLTVSFAAQIGILPLSLYYFHQFPSLFFISSLVIIPFLGLILGLGFLIILLAGFKILPLFMAKGYECIINYMNSFIQFISSQEQFIFNNLYISVFLTLCLYVILIALISYYYNRSFKALIVISISVLLIQTYFIYTKYQTFKTNKLIVYQVFNNTLIENRVKNRIFIYHSFDSLKAEENTIIKLKKFKHKAKINKVKNSYILQNKKVLIIDKEGVYQVNKLLPEIVLLRQSPKINLERVVSFLKPNLIIADGSNFNKDISYWEKTCKKLNIDFYSTAKNGAFQLVTSN